LGFGKTPEKIPSSASPGPFMTLRHQLPPQRRPTHQKLLLLPLPISQSPYTVQILMTHPKVKTEGTRDMEVKTEGANGKKIVKKFNRVEFVSQICSENLTREELEKQ
jgi:hypothetical protein